MMRPLIMLIMLMALAAFFPKQAVHGQTLPEARAEQLCILNDERINESSGIARSLRHPDLLWIHNDSGDQARLFLVGLDGNTRGEFPLAGVPMPLDWEDMCSFSIEGEPWLLIGDVGDNAITRHLGAPDSGPERACRLLLIREPALNDVPDQNTVPVHATMLFEYEDGPRNCESVAVDTERREILLVSKSKSTPLDCGVYRIPLTLDAGERSAVAQRIGQLDLPFATAMDIAPGNRRLVVLSAKGATIVDRGEGESWEEALKRDAPNVALPKRENGETVCFGSNPDELFLNSERTQQPVWRVTLSSAIDPR
jgi:hypothetical protein